MERLTVDVGVFALVALLGLLNLALSAGDVLASGRPRAALVVLGGNLAAVAAIMAALSAGVVSRWWPELIRSAGPYLRESLAAALLLNVLAYLWWRTLRR